MSVIHDTSVEQSKTGNPSTDATWDTCKLQKQNELQNEHDIPCYTIFRISSQIVINLRTLLSRIK